MTGLTAAPGVDADTRPLHPAARARRTAWDASRIRYLLFGQVGPAALYAVLGIGVVRNIAAQAAGVAGHDWLPALDATVWQVLYAAFCLIPVVLFVIRPQPRAADARLIPRATAFVATTMLLAVTLLPGGALLLTLPVWTQALASAILLLATAGEVWALVTLGLSFGIFPAVRSLVTRGPYRLVRHPLYLFESVCAVTALLPRVHLVPLLMVVAFCALQVRRLGYEEAILRRNLPEWSAWARGRPRLIPGIW